VFLGGSVLNNILYFITGNSFFLRNEPRRPTIRELYEEAGRLRIEYEKQQEKLLNVKIDMLTKQCEEIVVNK
jgi:hypothetical protein